jgi:glycerol-3-phosphate dehydrogenase
MNRAGQLARISGGSFQVLVVGGGITGAGIAWDCALRGLSVALLERTDFAAGSSSVSSKMVHAGLRYMVNDSELVTEAALERQRMFRACPHLARPLQFLLPAYPDTPEYGADTLPGILERYDRLARQEVTAPHGWLSSEETLRAVPALRRGPSRVGFYWDGIMDDARVTLEVIQAAAEAGAAVVNHAEVRMFLADRQGRVCGARFRDRAPGAGGTKHEVTADAVVCAAGAYTDLLLSLETERPRRPAIRPSKGVHLVFHKPITGGKALVIPVGGNVLYFLVPWYRDYLIMGTTDTDYAVQSYADLDRVPILEQEIRYNLELLERVLPGQFAVKDIVACYAGVRPLVRPENKAAAPLSESDTSRAHRIWQSDGGVWAIAGGKFTTFRLMAEQLADRVVGDLTGRGRASRVAPCTTAARRYHGAPQQHEYPNGIDAWLRETAAELGKRTGLAGDCCLHLAEAYGTAAEGVAALVQTDPELGKRLAPDRPFIRAEVRHAVQEEMCITLADFLARRTPLRFLERQGLDVAWEVAAQMAGYLGWDDAELNEQMEFYKGGLPWFPA